MPVLWRPTRERQARTGRRVPARRGRLLVALFIVTCAVIAGTPTAPGKAQAPSSSPNAQVRIFRDGWFVGGGTLVDRNWVLTALHLFDRPAVYTIRFGVVNDQNDPDDTTNLRSIEVIVAAPQGGDMAMLRLTNPVPEGTWIPQLATEAPRRDSRARHYGWGSDGGHTLNRTSTIVNDPVAAENAVYRRRTDDLFAWAFPKEITLMVLNLFPPSGDSGSGIFVDRGTLTGVHSLDTDYYPVDRAGNLVQRRFRASFNLPVWQYRQWILDTINGAGPSGTTPDPNQDELRRRRLTDAADGDLPMTLPPQPATCDEEDTPCNLPDPGWAQGVLLGAGNYRGTAQARCATAQNNTCSFNGTPYPPGTSTRMALGPASAPLAPGTRQVLVWCKTTTAFPNPDSPTRQVLRVSFTNADPDLSPIGYGWWDLTPDQVTTTTKTPLNTSQLNLERTRLSGHRD